mmetsp:Transcript_3163/g.8744  ORF Transcript_3163/g.8744 Transcript_3163/m.8744 type:complete len:409 (-) Transcript_3163:737-1963(-)
MWRSRLPTKTDGRHADDGGDAGAMCSSNVPCALPCFSMPCVSVSSSASAPPSSASNTSCVQPRRTANDRSVQRGCTMRDNACCQSGTSSSGSRSLILITKRTVCGYSGVYGTSSSCCDQLPTPAPAAAASCAPARGSTMAHGAGSPEISLDAHARGGGSVETSLDAHARGEAAAAPSTLHGANRARAAAVAATLWVSGPPPTGRSLVTLQPCRSMVMHGASAAVAAPLSPPLSARADAVAAPPPLLARAAAGLLARSTGSSTPVAARSAGTAMDAAATATSTPALRRCGAPSASATSHSIAALSANIAASTMRLAERTSLRSPWFVRIDSYNEPGTSHKFRTDHKVTGHGSSTVLMPARCARSAAMVTARVPSMCSLLMWRGRDHEHPGGCSRAATAPSRDTVNGTTR